MFSIGFTSEIVPDYDLAIGILVLDEHRENFESSLDIWTEADYESQWRSAVSHVVQGGPRAPLVTSMYDLNTANFIRWWLIYRFEATCVFREAVLFLDDKRRPGTVDDLYQLVPAYQTSNDDGMRISEWETRTSDLEEFLRSTIR